MKPQKVIFADRDGTINLDPGYISDKDQFKFIDGVTNFLNIFKSFGYRFIIVTNQGGVAKRKFTQADSIEFSNHVVDQLLNHGIFVEEVFSCFHHPRGVVKNLSISCTCRKPGPGLFLMAEEKFKIDKTKSIILGNNLSDIQAGMVFGLKTGFLLHTGSVSSKILDYQSQLPKEQKLYIGTDYIDLANHANIFLGDEKWK